MALRSMLCFGLGNTMKLYSLALSALMLAGLVAGSQAANQLTATDESSYTIRIANAAVASTYASSEEFSSERHERMADFAYMIGIWNLNSRATLGDGELLEAIGTRSCVWVLDRTAIRCDDSVDEVHASAGYPGLYENHDQLFYLTFNESDGRYEYTFMSPISANKQIYHAEFDEGSKTLTRFMHLENGDQVLPVRVWQVSNDEIREQAIGNPRGEIDNDRVVVDNVETVLNRKVPEASLTRF